VSSRFVVCVLVVVGGLTLAAQIPAPQNLRLVSNNSGAPVDAPPACEVPQALGGVHAFYDTLVRRSEHYCNWSLRHQGQLNSLTSEAESSYFTYNPAADNHPHRQDAARFFKAQYDRYHACDVIYGRVNFTGKSGVVVPKGTVLTRLSDGATYATNAAVTIGSNGTSESVRIDAVNPNNYKAEASSGTTLHVAATPGVNGTAAIDPKFPVKVKCSDSIPTRQQLKMPIRVSSGSVLITWDFYFPPEWRNHVGELSAYKIFKVQSGTGVSGGWWTLLSHLSKRSSEAAAIGPLHSGIAGDHGDAVTAGKPFAPTGAGALPSNTFQLHHSVWTRFWVEIKAFQSPASFVEWNSAYCKPGTGNNPCSGAGGTQIGPNPEDPAGRWHMASVWAADENRNPVTIMFRAPLAWTGDGRIERFDFEFNTSEEPVAQTGPLVGYGRNVVVLRNYQLPNAPLNDTLIFKRPIG
jgi:hypothetical protein